MTNISETLFTKVALQTIDKNKLNSQDKTRAPETPNFSDHLSAASTDSGNSSGIKINVDMNNDGIVNMADLNMQLANTGSDNMAYDHNNDGAVDNKDIDLLLSFWGQDGKMIMNNPDFDGNGAVDLQDLNTMLANFEGKDMTYDLNGDGTVNDRDLSALMSFWSSNEASEA